MLSTKYLKAIKDFSPGKIYVENVRSLYNIPRSKARIICEMAVHEGLFEKRIGLICPAQTCHGRIIADYSSLNDIPEMIECNICSNEQDEDAQSVQSLYKTSDLKKIVFYQLKRPNENA